MFITSRPAALPALGNWPRGGSRASKNMLNSGSGPLSTSPCFTSRLVQGDILIRQDQAAFVISKGIAVRCQQMSLRTHAGFPRV